MRFTAGLAQALVIVQALVVVVGCTDSGATSAVSSAAEGGAGSGGASGDGGVGGTMLCPAVGFADPTDHRLPAGFAPDSFEHLAGVGACGGGKLQPHYGVTDLDGDGLPDLVVTDNCADAAVGQDVWWRFVNDGTAFGSAVPWGLPNYGPDAFEGLSGGGACGGGDLKPSYGLVDLDSDGLVDLVVTDNCIDAAVGRRHWLLYANTGAGFGSATEWSLPDYGPDAFDGLAGGGDCGAGILRPAFALVDIDGDDQLELVVTDDCIDDAVGRSRWLVFDNVGDGFAPNGSSWTLPDYGPSALEHVASPGSCTNGARPAYGLVDLDDDALPDLVVTDTCVDNAIGTSSWRLHHNTGAAFADGSVAWSLPDYGPDAFEQLAGAGSCGGGKLEPAYGLVDLDGAGRIELVVTDTCQNDGIGDNAWRVHSSNDAGFASASSSFALPDYGPRAFEQLAGTSACAGDDFTPSYGLLDLDGEGHLDLVVTNVCTDAPVGNTHWRRHDGICQ